MTPFPILENETLVTTTKHIVIPPQKLLDRVCTLLNLKKSVTPKQILF